MEEIEMVYNVPQQIPLEIMLPIYFYLTGLSAGSFLLSTMAYGFGIKRFKSIGKVGVIMAVLLLALAPVNLLVDMGQIGRFWHLIIYLNLTSPISYGFFLLNLYPLNCVIYAYFMFKGNDKMTKTFGLIGIPLALAVHGYTGFILAMAKGRILGNTALMPPLFLVSAMVSGVALMILVVIVKDRFFSPERRVDKSLVIDLSKLLLANIVLDLTLVLTDVVILLTSDEEAFEAAMLILKGSFAPYFVGVEMLLGSVLPLLILLFPWTKRAVPAIAVASALVMFGIFAMRYVMVIGGQHIPLV